VANIALLVGDRTGVRYRFEKGAMKTDTPILIASASKLVFGAFVWTLIERGELSRTSRPQDNIDFWTGVTGDGRSAITLDMLMGFTSGFNRQDGAPGCVGESAFSLQTCVRQIYDSGLDTLPDSAFSYGPEHMQIAALMVANKRGQSVDQAMREVLLDPLEISAVTRYTQGAGDNPRYAGSLRSTGEDYAKLLTAILSGNIAPNRAAFLEDRTGNRVIDFRPGALDDNNLDWRYGFGFWKECDVRPYAPSCDAAPVISSPGAFGFTPWVDFENDYWGIIVLEETSGALRDPASFSVDIEQDIQPLIEVALGR
jgi:CubicO group peptidase (beta-lactamase class C family)